MSGATDPKRCQDCGYPLDIRPDEYGIDCLQPCKICEGKQKRVAIKKCDDCPFSGIPELKKELAKAKRDISFWQKKWSNRAVSTASKPTWWYCPKCPQSNSSRSGACKGCGHIRDISTGGTENGN